MLVYHYGFFAIRNERIVSMILLTILCAGLWFVLCDNKDAALDCVVVLSLLAFLVFRFA